MLASLPSQSGSAHSFAIAKSCEIATDLSPNNACDRSLARTRADAACATALASAEIALPGLAYAFIAAWPSQQIPMVVETGLSMTLSKRS